MLENKITKDSISKQEKVGQASANRLPLRHLTHENIPMPIIPNKENPQELKYYFQEIFIFLAETEENFYSACDYFQFHTELTHANRAFLID